MAVRLAINRDAFLPGVLLARGLIRAGQLLKLELLDHVIIVNGNRSSLRELGYFFA
jgi:DNA repair protein RadC